MTGYRGTDGDTAPVAFEYEPAPRGDLPAYTAAGEKIYTNTHFKTEAEAWDSILRSVAAYVTLAGRTVARARVDLAAANENAGRASEEFKTAHDNYECWKAGQKDVT